MPPPPLNKSLVVQIHMKDAESAESKEKSNFRFFRFLFFELWSFLYSNLPNFFCLQNCSNLCKRCGIGWIKRKIKFKIFPIIIFSSYSHFCNIITPIFDESFMIANSKNKNLNLFLFSFYSAHSTSTKTGSKQRRGWGGNLHILSWEKSKCKFSMNFHDNSKN